jgi:hypothetical protein
MVLIQVGNGWLISLAIYHFGKQVADSFLFFAIICGVPLVVPLDFGGV